ncbi:type VI secretion system tip protein VgrG [Pantoea sp. Al-1710]|uniref:Type VI secretion system tip protein VgrG n=1 Tax=Candidatus Pantoea communis TaxID=2608354 RepID=A0ABX0RVU4_9GAMM|nr:type VI secretion system Vgr family protein [Pantoea communis]NIG19844.1 type VI secretion system tip protein VgrG [Pantoea communis]
MALVDIATKIGQTLSGSMNRYDLSVEGGAAALDVESFKGDEALSRLYAYEITFSSLDSGITPQQMLLKNASFSFNAPGMQLAVFSLPSMESPRTVHGVITQFQRLSSSLDETRYQATLEPRLALLGNASRPAIFQNQSVPEIVEQILRDNHQFEGWQFEFRLRGTYPRREQVMQWQESDLAFIERLLSEVGIWYRFEADSRMQQEIVIFADDQQFYQFDVSLPLRALSGMNDGATESVWKLSSSHQVVSQAVKVKDYNYRDAQNGLLTDGDAGADSTAYGEVYRYSDNYLTQGAQQDAETETGAFYARLRHERLLNAQHQLSGASNAATLQPGQMLEIIGDVPPLFTAGVVITAISAQGGRDASFTLSWQGIPYSETVGYRPQVLKRPTIAGTLQARVTSVTENDTYAHLDESGRYKVKFDFDLTQWKTGYESLWVRLAKPYSGDTYGWHMPLIAGTEVAIAFEAGNPDRPYIAYALHDSRNEDHVSAANHKRNVIRTPANNKLRMEDERGKEHIKLSTEYGGKSQLNLGHLVDGERTQRGEGFELRSDSWGAIRAGKGLFISADGQELAQGQALDMQAAIAQLEKALALAQSLSKAAENAKAAASDTHSQESLNNALKKLVGAGMVLHAPEGVGVVSPKAVRVASGNESVGIAAGGNIDISSGKSFTASSQESVSMYAKTAGIKAYAGKGDVDIQAQNDAMNLLAKQAFSITSVESKVTIAAHEELLLSCGGGYIRLKDGNIELGCPGNILLKSSNVQKMGSANINITPPELPTGYSEYFTAIDETSGQIIPNKHYRITTGEGDVYEGYTDDEGNTAEISTVMPNSIKIEFL